MNVLQLKKQLTGRAQIPKVAEVRVRNFSGPRDIPVWADLITAAFAAARPPVRRWSPAECERRILQQPWWRAQRMWFAETNGDSQVVGRIFRGSKLSRKCAGSGVPGGFRHVLNNCEVKKPPGTRVPGHPGHTGSCSPRADRLASHCGQSSSVSRAMARRCFGWPSSVGIRNHPVEVASRD